MANENVLELVCSNMFFIFVSLITVIMPQNILNKSLGTDASLLRGSGDEPSVFGAYSFHTSEVECFTCGVKFQKRNGSINEALKRGFKIYCGRKCSGLGRRSEGNIGKIDKKVCNNCGEEKSVSEFETCDSKINKRIMWYDNECRKCIRISKKVSRGIVNPVLNPDETFVFIIGTDYKYKIGDFGTVLSCDKDMGELKFTVIKEHIGYKEYRYVRISINKKVEIKKPHRLVAIHFIDNPENKPQVNHLDGDKGNNTKKNLAWATPSENMSHAFLTGLNKPRKGVDHHNNKLSECQVVEIYKSPLSCNELAKIYPVRSSTIFNIKAGNIWVHLTKKIKK